MSNSSDILISVKVDEKDAIKGVDGIDSSVEELNKSIGTLAKTSVTAFSDIDDTIEGAADSYDDLTKSVEKNTKKTTDGATKSNKAMGLLKKGAKGVGTAFKAMGIGALVALLAALWEAMQRNQKVMDAVNTVLETVSIMFNQITTTIVEAYEKVSKATGGFDAMKIVLINLLKIGITPLKLGFLAIKASVLSAQLAWEKSIFGGKDPDKIKELTADLKEVKDEVIQIGVDTLESGQAIADNIGEAVSEVGQLVKTVAVDVTATVENMNISSVNSMAKSLVQMRKNYDVLEIKQEAVNLKSLEAAELQRQMRDNENETYEARIEANNALGEILEEQLEREQILLDEKIRIAEFELEMDQDNHEKQLDLMRLLEVEQAELNERITGQKSEQLSNQVALEKEANQKILDDKQKALDASTKQIEENNKLLLEFKKISEEERLQVELETNIKRIEESTLTEDQKFELMMNAYNDYENELTIKQQEKLDQDKKDSDELKEHQANNLKDGLAIFSSLSSAYAEITNKRLSDEANAISERHQQELDSFVGTEEEKEVLVKKQKTEVSRIEHEQALANKRQKLVSAVIEGGLAMLASIAQLGPIFGPIVGGALIATNIGLIASQDVPPAITYANGGVLKGKSHAEGGILTPFGELEGEEGVINKVSMSNPNLRNLASAANEGGGGVAFGDGNPISVVLTNPQDIKASINLNELDDAQDEIDLIDTDSYI